MSINKNIAKIFREISTYLLMDDIPFRPQAYEKAALVIEALDDDLDEIYRKEGEKGLREIKGIGERMSQKIVEYLKTGKIKEYERMKKKMPVDLESLMMVEGIGPKIIKELYRHLKITNLNELEIAAQAGKIRKLPHFGLKTEQNILQGIEFLKRTKGRFLLAEALLTAEKIIKELKKIPAVDQIVYAGSLRRMKETIGDIDLLATLKTKNETNTRQVMDAFVNLKGVVKVWDYGLSKSSIHLSQGLDVDLRIVKDYEFGSALQYFTGSKEHNIVLRKIALDKGLKLNEYGVFKGKKLLAGKNEKEIYKLLGLEYIEPELRENIGEIEAAQKHQLPHLIKYTDLKGDLHTHSDWDGGQNSIEEIAQSALKLNYEYIGIADHTQFLKIEHGLDEKQLLLRNKEIDHLNEKFKKAKINFRILKGCEANILDDGRLDIEDKVLSQLDFVIAGLHSGFKNSKEQLTERLIKAMKNPNVDIISHPTGRLIGRRDEYELDFDKIIKVAKETKTALEVNSFPERLDLKDTNIKKAIQNGIKLAINSDAHQIDQLVFVRYGLSQVRRGWAEKKDILNALKVDQLLSYFQS